MYGKMYTNLLAWGIKVMNDMYKEDIEARWQLLVWRTVIAICGVTFALSWILYGVHRVEKNIGSGLYMLEYIFIPMAIQIITLVVCYFMIKADNISNEKKNYVVIGLIFVSIGVISFTYYSVLPLIMLPILTIVATALFADQSLTIWSGVVVAILTVIDMVRYHFEYTDSVAGLNWVGVLSIFLLLIILLCVMVVIVNTHTKALMSSIMGSYNRQVTLMSELMIDPMTGLYNRRSFEDSLEKEIERAEQTGAKSYVTIFDIDHFKEVNDTYGHSNGDIVIKALCKMMKEKSKDMGLAFRYGGEEFVILFHDVELSKVMNNVEDIRTEFRCYYFHFMNKDGITCSCGVAEYIKGESSKAWFNRADSALYKAKESGRNRTVISE